LSSKLIALEVNVASRATVSSVSAEIKESLTEGMSVSSGKAKKAGNMSRSTNDAPRPREFAEDVTPADLAGGYRELGERYLGLLTALKERVGEHLTFTFDPMQRPDLAEAIATFFRGVNDKITYKMYLAALEMEREIAMVIAEDASVHL